MVNQIKMWFDTETAWELMDPHAAVYLLLAVLVFYVGKLVNDKCSPYDLNEQLTTVDNKAIALSFAGYIFALGIILYGVLSSDSTLTPSGNVQKDLLKDLGNTALWGLIGIGLLQVARIINDKLLLYQFNNMKELVEDKNVGTGAVQCGAYIGSALMIRAVLTDGEDAGFIVSLVATLVYFVIGQLAFIAFSRMYQITSRFDLHGEIEKDNVAAGVGFGMTLTAVGMVLSGYIIKFDSLIGLVVWFFISAFLLLTCRYLVDKVILPGSLLDEEVSRDHNWGAAMVEGSAAIGLAMLLNAAF